MGFMTMLLTNPFLYSWIVERAFNGIKNTPIRVKKLIYAPKFDAKETSDRIK
ncbi:MAG TPA: hypothetical protein VEG44_04015 [Candidatus Acidoferrales bacterium]|nr:hypothetical protein [Candidatus Acidoferrales bacterium]